MLAPISWRTPPRHYGPWELVTSLLTEALVARGVDVTLFATQDSRTAAKLAGVCPAPYSEDPSIDAKAWEMLHVAHVFERAGEFDLIHNQADFVPLAFSRLVDNAGGDDNPRLFLRSASCPPSRRMRTAFIMSRSATPIHTVGSELCGDDPPRYSAGGLSLRPMGQRRPALLRSHPPGQGSRRSDCGGNVELVGGWSWPASSRIKDYHEKAGRARARRRFGGLSRPGGRDIPRGNPGFRRALLHLVNFEEPFGLSVVEALACGTPVIASNRGSMPELIEHGVTGTSWSTASMKPLMRSAVSAKSVVPPAGRRCPCVLR